MFDIKLLRENLDMIKANAKRRGCDVDVDALAAMDKEYLALIKEVEDLRAKRNALSKECQKNPEAREQVTEGEGRRADELDAQSAVRRSAGRRG